MNLNENRPVRVLHTMTWLAPGGGADTNVLLSIQGQLAQPNRYEVHFSVGAEIFHNEFAHQPGLKLHYCRHLFRPIKPFKDLRSIWYYYRLLRREKIDLIHTHEAKASLIGRVAGWLARTPVIVFGLHGVMYNDPAFSPRKRSLFVWLERLTVWPSHCIVAVSKSCLEHYDADRIGRKLERYVVYSGIDVQRFEQNSQLSAEKRALLRKELGFAEPDVVLINVGRFTYGKAQRHTIAAFAQLRKKHNHLKLLLVGEGDLQAQCREQAQQLGVAQDVVFYGFTENVPQIMGLADINVLTSLREGLPRVVVEASLCGLPTAAFEVEGIREILTDGQSGFIVPQEDEEALANALDILITQPEKRKRFASEAKMHARQHWSHHTMVAELDKIYEHYLRKKRIWK